MLLIGWLLAVQSFSTAHASVHGDDPHEHDGVACAVLVLGEDELAVLPEIDPPVFISAVPIETYFAAFTPTLYISPQGRAPPPRAPPVTL